MKNLNIYIKESLLDDEDVLMKGTSEKVIEENVNKFLKDNYKGIYKISKKPINGKYIVDCSRNLYVKNKNITSLTNEYFEFGSIGGYFECSWCNSLTSLKGAPKKVGGDFACRYCKSLTSLEGAPKEVGGDFDCRYCKSLTSLEGAPKEVGGHFFCCDCNSLTTLKGSPEKVGRDFNCSFCRSLTSLEGSPENVGDNFYCLYCNSKFTEEDVRNVSNVGGQINC